MKNFYLPLLFACLISCSGDDGSHESIGINGKWNLVEIQHPFVGETIYLEDGDITWDFNEAAHKIAIENNVGSESFGIETGTYDYDILVEEDVCDSALYVDTDEYEFDTNLGCITLQGQTLQVSSAYVDGAVYLLKKTN